MVDPAWSPRGRPSVCGARLHLALILAAFGLLVLGSAWGGVPGNAKPSTAIGRGPGQTPAPIAQQGNAGVEAWRSTGPYGGDVQALALSPDFASDGLALAGGWRTGAKGPTDGYGIVRTLDHGATWVPVFTGPPYQDIAVFDLVISPGFAADGTAFAATDQGVFRSTDRGMSWDRLITLTASAAGGEDPAADDIAFIQLSPDFERDGSILAARFPTDEQQGDLYRSTDRGVTWSRALVGAITAATFSLDFAANGTVFAAARRGVDTQLMRSTDGGLAWEPMAMLVQTQVNDLLETADESALLLASDHGVVRLVRGLAEGDYVPDPVEVNVEGQVNRLATAGDNIYAAAERGLFISLSFGRNWHRVSDTPAMPFRAVAPCPLWGLCHALMAGTHAGLIYTPDDNWQPWSWLSGPHPAQARGVAASPAFAVDGTLFAATDHGLFRSTDCGESWRLMALGEPPGHDYAFAAVRISPGYPSDGTVFATLEDRTADSVGLFKSVDHGLSWTSRFDIGGPALALSPDYVADRTVFVGHRDLLYKSADGGSSWSSYSLAPAGAPPDGFYIQELEISPAYPTDRTLYASGFGSVRRSTDGGINWKEMNGFGPSYGLAISPAFSADGTMWHTYRSIEAPGDEIPESGILRSEDRGTTWSQPEPGLPGGYEPFPWALAVSPDYATDRSLFTALRGQLVSSSRHSLYRSVDSGNYWNEIGSAPGNPDVFDLAATPRTGGSLMAHLATATGIWHYQAPCEERLANSSFELNYGWYLPVTPATAAYSTQHARSGLRSVRIGIDSAADVYSYSSASQFVTIPAGISNATLRFWWYPISGEAPSAAGDEPKPASLVGATAETLPTELSAEDRQYVLLLDTAGTIIASLLWIRSNAQAWQEAAYDVTAHRGHTIRVYFGVFNDGSGGRTAMYVDDASLRTCWPALPPPTPTPAPTHEPRPRGYLPLIHLMRETYHSETGR